MGLMTTDTLYFHFFISFSVSFRGGGAVFLGSKNICTSKENHYSIGTFKEKSFVGNSVSDSLHLTWQWLHIISIDSKQIQKYAVSLRHRCLPSVGS
jgi:hypothetical protein